MTSSRLEKRAIKKEERLKDEESSTGEGVPLLLSPQLSIHRNLWNHPCSPGSFCAFICFHLLSFPLPARVKSLFGITSVCYKTSKRTRLNFKGINFSNAVTHRPVIFPINQWAIFQSPLSIRNEFCKPYRLSLYCLQNAVFLQWKEQEDRTE